MCPSETCRRPRPAQRNKISYFFPYLPPYVSPHLPPYLPCTVIRLAIWPNICSHFAPWICPLLRNKISYFPPYLSLYLPCIEIRLTICPHICPAHRNKISLAICPPDQFMHTVCIEVRLAVLTVTLESLRTSAVPLWGRCYIVSQGFWCQASKLAALPWPSPPCLTASSLLRNIQNS